MSQQSRLASLISAIGADIKAHAARLLLAGGTTGQVLTKSSNADYATGWSTLVLPFGWPASGDWANPWNVTGSASAAPVTGNLDLESFFVPGPVPRGVSAIAINVATALVPGSATYTCKLALYPDNGSGAPDTTTILEQGDISLTSTGRQQVLITRTLSPGRYWAAFLYSISAAPTTAPALTCINGSLSLPVPNGLTTGTIIRTLRLSGQTALPTTTQSFPAGSANGGSNAPVICLRAA